MTARKAPPPPPPPPPAVPIPAPRAGGAGPDPSARWALDHAPFLATLLLFLFVAFRVLRVAAFDPATATTLVRESGPVTVAVGVLVTALPQILQISAYLLMLIAQGGPGTDAQRRAATGVAFAVVFVLDYLLPWNQLLFYVLFLTAIFFAQRRLRWPLGIYVVVAVVITTLLDVPVVWLPPEVVAESGGHQTVGYVLTRDEQWTTVLVEEDRSIKVLDTANVDSRRVCNLEPRTTARTVSQIILGEEGGLRNPRCPEPEEE